MKTKTEIEQKIINEINGKIRHLEIEQEVKDYLWNLRFWRNVYFGLALGFLIILMVIVMKGGTPI